MSLFFVLSGFVLAYRYGSANTSFRDYFSNRLARIYPVYLLAAVLTLPWIGVDASTAGGVARMLMLIAIDLLVLQAWFPQLFTYWNNGGSWSVSVEMFCYMVLPFVFQPLRGMTTKRLLQLAGVLYVLAVLPGATLTMFYGEFGRSFYSLPIYRLPEILIGVCAWFAVSRGFSLPKFLLPVSLVAFATYLSVLGPRLPMWVGHNWIVLPVLTIAIISLTTGAGPINRVLCTFPFVWLGKISYSFYSLQVFLLLYLETHHADIVSSLPALHDNWLLLVVSFCVLVAMSGLSYHLIEEPARLWLANRSRMTAARLARTSGQVASTPQAAKSTNLAISSLTASGGGVRSEDQSML
jgi:peptidoglycan/LPS O-acetylase OafA/YrhL